MRFIEDLCPPALLYLVFLVIQLGFDASLGLWITFLVKLVLGFATVYVLDIFCGMGLGLFSWFIITSLATAISMGLLFDQTILSQIAKRENFLDGKMEAVPAMSNDISPE
jgi:hypothetical protein